MNERNTNTKSMKLKAFLVAEDDENWLCIHQVLPSVLSSPSD
jgi:hypothetical protein